MLSYGYRKSKASNSAKCKLKYLPHKYVSSSTD